jgi:hypothetical protein
MARLKAVQERQLWLCNIGAEIGHRCGCTNYKQPVLGPLFLSCVDLEWRHGAEQEWWLVLGRDEVDLAVPQWLRVCSSGRGRTAQRLRA